MKLLTYGNPKIAKGEGHGWLTAILHLAPHTLSGYQTCPHATAECSAACLESAGRGGIYAASDTQHIRLPDGRRVRTNTIRRARIARTHLFFESPDAFLAQLWRELAAHVRRATRHGLRPAVRLNGTSDIRWESVTYQGQTVFEAFPGIRFYDYTKIPDRAAPSVYHLTFSFSGRNQSDAVRWLREGRNVAVVFAVGKGKPLPATWHGFPVLDADKHDLRFLDPRGYVAGLRAKGKARKLPAGSFVQEGRAS